jgi:hypothetical protein
MHPFGRIVLPKEKNRRLAECPFKVRVADLVVAAFHTLAGGFVRAFHKPCVGDEITDIREATDVIDLVEDDKSENWTNARNGTEQMERNRIMIFGLTPDLRLQVEKYTVIHVKQVEIGFNARACAGIGKKLLDPDPIFGRSEALLE